MMENPGIITGQAIKSAKLARAKELRRNMTQAEAVLWSALRRNQLGVHFRRQQVISGMIVDFYCHSARLVVEVDGDVHLERLVEDQERDEVIRGFGLNVIHIQNDEVMNNLPKVLGQLKSVVSKAPHSL